MIPRDRRPKKKEELKMSPDAARMMLIVGFLKSFKPGLTTNATLVSALKVLLDISGLNRAYAFLNVPTEEGMSLQELARVDSEEGTEEYTISRSMLMKGMNSGGEPLIQDSEDVDDSTISIHDFKICTVVVLPILNFETQEVEGVLYADKRFASKKLPAHVGYSLRLLSEAVSRALYVHSKEKNYSQAINSYNDFLANAADELEVISENLKKIAAAVGSNPLSELRGYIDGQSTKLHEISQCISQAD